MIRGILAIAVLQLGTSLLAQDQPLGDVARATREHVAQTKPAKVLTDEEGDGRVITADDDPIEVVTKAATAMLHDTSHRCREQSAGNSGPGWSQVKQTEVAGVDRIRLTGEQDHIPNETILIGQNGYRKVGSGAWARLEGPELSLLQHMLDSIKLPNELKFGYNPGDLKLIGPEVIAGVATFHYQMKIQGIHMEPHGVGIDRTIDIWVGTNDYLPRRTEMVTHNLEMKTDWRTTTECTYGIHIPIEPPL